MKDKITFLIAFSVGYWVGQTQHGIKPLFIATFLAIAEVYVFRWAYAVWKDYRKIPNNEITEL